METERPNMEPVDFEVRTHLKFGIGEAGQIQKYINELGFKKPLIVIDSHVINSEYGQAVMSKFNNHMEYIVYDFGEPTYTLLEQFRERTQGVDCMVGIGGGSVIDFSKGLALLSTNKGAAIEYRGFPTGINKPLPVIAVPTTAGTGSEVTYNAVFTDTSINKKLGINTKENFPVLAILDPTFLKNCPREVLISTGMDGLVHTLESFSATKSNIVTKPLSVVAFEYILPALENLNIKYKDDETLSMLMIGSYYAGIALMNSGSGPTGALSYILGTNFNVPHGIAGATFLPHIIKHNEDNGYEYQYMLSINRKLSDIVFDLCAKLDINNYSLQQFNVTPQNIEILLKETESLEGAFKQNPVVFTVEDAKALLRRMI